MTGRGSSGGPEGGIRQALEGTWHKEFSFSPVVKASGGTTLYLAGVGVCRDGAGRVLDFEAQVRATFEDMRATLARAGAALDDIVTMTVFVNDIRNGKRFTEIRREYFAKGYPASALIGVSAFMDPAMQVEVQAVAVVSA
jgi:enamine deaminase RidA (YjgF/YER057c/UK114 family)